jgi:SNF2 family DNA or RNA helicase
LIQGNRRVQVSSVQCLDELRRFKVVLTNYETVVNYQHSFAKMRWTAVVTDEAQEYKTPSTKVSHALKAMNSRFRIACTGTPVETRLFDVWNLFDFLQPGPLLGSAAEFRRDYESESDNGAGLPKLKERLKLGCQDAFLLRRNKEDVLDLPPKTEQPLDSLRLPDRNRELVRIGETVRCIVDG